MVDRCLRTLISSANVDRSRSLELELEDAKMVTVRRVDKLVRCRMRKIDECAVGRDRRAVAVSSK